MSAAIYAWASQQEAGSPLNKLILLTMADWADQEGIVIAPSEMLAKFCECSCADVSASLAEMVELKILQWDGSLAYLPAPDWSASPFRGSQRHRVYERDDWRCVYCSSPEELTLDHVIPKSRGGTNRDENLVAACRQCNASKGARTPEEWRGS